jgi:O-glycosyl hydrolase
MRKFTHFKTINALNKSLLLCAFIVTQFSSSLFAQTVTPWLTKGDQSVLLQKQATVSFGANSGTNPSTVTVNPSQTFQTMDGFGWAMTEGSAELILSLATAQQDALLNELYNPTTGLSSAAVRIGLGASDLSSSDYTYSASVDLTMANFSLAGPDQTYLIPVLKKILLINPNIKILATPWTPPIWMKSNNSYRGGSLQTQYYNAYGRYFVKYVQAMAAQGITIWAVTPQNEPENPNNDPSMAMTSTEQKNFINQELGPQFAAAGITTKIIAFDHNCDNTAYPIDVLNNSTYVDGAGFHLYAGNISAMTTVHDATNKNVYFTEQYTGSPTNFSGDFAWHMQMVVMGSTNNWGKTVFEWNVASDPNLNPHTPGPGTCTTCLGAVTISNSTTYTRNVQYYIIGQISKFVKVGAVRLGSSTSSSMVNTAAFRNPDGSIAMLVYNANTAATTVKVVNGSNAFNYSIPAASAVTFNWSTGPPVVVTGVSVSPTSATVAVNNTKQLTATIAPANATNTSVTWTSSNTAVASVNSNGLVSGIAAGTATITVKTADGNKTATSAITVNVVATTGVSVSPTSASIFAGQTQQLTASVLPATASNKAVTWTSSNTAIATVSSSGLVSAVAQGTATITVKTTSGNFTATTAMTVKGQEPYTGTNIALPGVVQAENFDKGGQNLAYNDIDATNNGNQYRTAEGVDIDVIAGTTGYTVGWTAAGEWLEYTTNVTAGNYSVIATVATPSSGKQMVVKLDGVTLTTINIPNTGGYGTFQNVTVTGVAFTGGNNKVLRFEIVGGDFNIDKVEVKSVVNVAVTGVTMSPTSATVGVGSTTQLSATVAPSTATNKAVTWTSSNTAIATVNSSGVVTGVAVGTATITVKTTDGNKTATCAITVTAAPTSSFPGYYNILSRSSGKGLDVANNATNSGAGVQQYDIANGGGSNQRWKFVATGSNFNIIVKSTQMCLAPSGTGTANGEKVQQRTCGTGNEFKWTVTSIGGGFYKIVNVNSGKALDVENASTANGGLIQVYDIVGDGGTNQNWSFTQVEATARVASESEASEEMLVYPNPAENVVKINSKYLSNGMVEFAGMTGSVVMKVSNNTPSTEKTIDISSLKQGLYIIKVANEDGFETKKLVKE